MKVSKSIPSFSLQLIISGSFVFYLSAKCLGALAGTFYSPLTIPFSKLAIYSTVTLYKF